jgi:hypothetical protein
MDQDGINRQEYIRRVLDAYRATPSTTGQIRRADRILAGQLYDAGVPAAAVANALVLAAARRVLRAEDASPLEPVRSLYYFRAVIDEVMNLSVGDDYFDYLRGKLERYAPVKNNR